MDLHIAGKKISDKYPPQDRGMVSHYGILVDNKEFALASYFSGTVCHGSLGGLLRGSPQHNNVSVFTLFSTKAWRAHNAGDPKESVATIAFLDWVLNDSPFADGFITKDAMYAIEHGVFSNIEAPYNIVMGGLMMYRLGWDFSPWVVDLWFSLVEKGVAKDVAFLLAVPANRRSESSFIWDRSASNHDPIDPTYFDDEAISRFLNKKFAFEDPPIKKGKHAVYSVFMTFRKTPPEYSECYVNKYGRHIKANKEYTVKSVWGPNTRTFNGVPYKSFIKELTAIGETLEGLRCVSV